MRAMTLQQVREALVGAKAVAFFEAWAAAEAQGAGAHEEADDLYAQSLVSEARANAADHSVRAAPTGAASYPLLRAEADALRLLAESRTARLRQEASERRQRAAALRAQSEAARGRFNDSERKKVALRKDAADFDAVAGECLLFFADSENPGGAFVVPLSPLLIAATELPALVLHRLAAGAPLESAVPVREPRDEPAKEEPKAGKKKSRRAARENP